MAFIDFAQPAAGLVNTVSPQHFQKAAVAGFDRVEWQIVALSRTDGLGSLGEPGRLHRIAALLFGARPSKRLADDRLEALRRLAVEAWHRGYAVSLSALDAFRKAGFSNDQLELLLATISAGRSARGRRS